ncbi:glutaredoxin 2 [Ostreibacterium oceani]|nr:glutaredoxin 2 [Ostreibacterium oceani]
MTIVQPTLYYYEHCPYCIRVLAFIGLHDISMQYQVLLNDDEKTPIAMVGKKMVPILQTAPDRYMGESLDIIDYLSSQHQKPVLKDDQDIAAVEGFLQANRLAIYQLTMPRWAKIPYAEFATSSAVDYFVKKKTALIGDFDTALAETDVHCATLFDALEQQSALFEKLAASPSSLASIMLFASLHGVSVVKGFAWPEAASAFMQAMAQATQCALADSVV